MALSSSYVLPINRIPDIFNKIRDGQAPERFSNQLLKDWGFTSTNDRGFISLLKSLGFLSSEGKPTQRYNDYRDHSRSKQIMGETLRDAYGDIFLIKEHPTQSDKNAIEGKFKSFHNASDHVAGLMTKTFLGLLNLADLSKKPTNLSGGKEPERKVEVEPSPHPNGVDHGVSGLHYNIQIHLPATKDVEVYNSIFKSLKEHLLEK
ncbi:DUF5343 domain-containing protein [Paracidobacterium acidisoli]|uniref:DUF5343 domain-containing protein n=1 Tax=Paracidobacterium acidisoli TaxID=2303751 RepID=A0A372IRR2_9BACT|nr:DUF5343 domain-containing protein [Paracidobacterium acidisoli]MBT9330334.1 DUF5343 domain-containing protein [Paracidobacterium acidisoli]